MDGAKTGTRRRHAQQLKRQVLAECAQPGASVAKVALHHGLNANLVHKWRRQAQPAALPAPSFLPVSVTPAPVAVTSDSIRLELQRGAVTVKVAWPVEAADQCAAWLREVWR
jgi:transposase